MITISCDKHKAEAQAWYQEWRKDHLGPMTPELRKECQRDRLLFIATQPVDPPCPDCKTYGLSKRGIIEELDSPDDWIFS